MRNDNFKVKRFLFLAVLSFIGEDLEVSAADKGKSIVANGTNVFTHEIAQGSEKPDSHAWSEIVGRKVVVQGVVWGALEKGYGPYLMMNRSVVYIDSNSFPAAKLQGTIVEIEGELRLQKYRNVTTAAGSSNDVDVYSIRPSQVKELPRVTWPWMRLAK